MTLEELNALRKEVTTERDNLLMLSMKIERELDAKREEYCKECERLKKLKEEAGSVESEKGQVEGEMAALEEKRKELSSTAKKVMIAIKKIEAEKEKIAVIREAVDVQTKLFSEILRRNPNLVLEVREALGISKDDFRKMREELKEGQG